MENCCLVVFPSVLVPPPPLPLTAHAGVCRHLPQGTCESARTTLLHVLLLMSLHCATSIVLYSHTNNAAGCMYSPAPTATAPNIPLCPSLAYGISAFWAQKASRLQCTFLMALSADQCSNLCKCDGFRNVQTTTPEIQLRYAQFQCKE